MKKAILICWLLLAAGITVIWAQDTWIQKADFGGTGRAVAVAFSIGGKGYLGTGINPNGGMRDFWEFDPATNVWTQKADVGGEPRSYAIGISLNGKGYIGTGLKNDGTYAQDFWEYDPIGNSWAQKSDFAGGPRSGAMAFAINSKVYVGTGEAGGINGGSTKDLWEYDPSVDSWIRKADFSGNPIKSSTALTISGKGYLVLGVSDGQFVRVNWEYDPASDLWVQKADFGGAGRNVAAGFSIGGKGYVGTGESDGTDYSDFWEYDPVTDVWLQKSDYGEGEIGWAAGFAIGTKGYIGTGYTWGVGYRSVFWEYTPELAPVTAFADSDNDGFGTVFNRYFAADGVVPAGYVLDSTDCNDADSAVNPAAAEICNSIDDDCDALTDDVDPSITGQPTWYVDADADEYGSSNLTIVSCVQPFGYVLVNGDCDDANSAINPSATDVCNFVDDNCNGLIDEVGITVNISADGPTMICSGGSVVLEAPTGNLYLYQWMKNNVPITAATLSMYLAKNTGDYSLQMSAGLCSAQSNSISVTESPKVQAGINPSAKVDACFGQLVTLTSTGGSDADSYQWMRLGNIIPGATTSTYTLSADEQGSFTVIVTTPIGCSGSSKATTLNRIPIIAGISYVTNNLCIRPSVKLAANSGKGLSYQWQMDGIDIPGATKGDYTATVVGSYTVVVTYTSCGMSKVSAPVSVIKPCKEEGITSASWVQLKLYPNPTDGSFIVELNFNDAVNSPANVQVINSLGQIVYNEKTSVANGMLLKDVQLNSLPAGVYLVKVIVSDQVYSSQIHYQK